MKKYIITSLLFFVSAVAVADDSCTNPNEYTIDRRCYVSDEKKAQKPYSAVVGVLGSNNINNCTGTIVKENDAIYMYTARHCIWHKNWSGDSYSIVDDLTVKVKLQNGTVFEVVRDEVSDKEDLAVYKFYSKDKNAVKDIAITKTDNSNSKNAVYSGVRLVGYGALKIMSDKEISDFKKAYEKYLRDTVSEEYMLKQRDEDGGIEVNWVSMSKEWPELSNDMDKLKESVCDYYVRYGGDGCQGWHGNSGGPVLDQDDKIMALLSKGPDVIGGEKHARTAGGASGTSNAGTVSFLKKVVPADK